ncbi:sigma-54 dependent transcriptional regulator [Paraferrimonas sp. SM1919]|uniref:sigma-54 dependent transcriptional regulator n=1 Tax=Paraferrimonas sp. SM1919 TaxID=2662263 RepID=UPI0013D09E28|nr:sigma-54 dependent transcriptional regulator [Paraferrimonas sp. SM1919]
MNIIIYETNPNIAQEIPNKGIKVQRCFAIEEFSRLIALSAQPMVIINSDNEAKMTQAINAIKHNSINVPFVVLVDFGQSHLAAEAISHGATDYLLHPFESAQLEQLIERLVIVNQEQSYIAKATSSKQLLQLAHRAAQTDASILLTGQSGTGKEQLSKYIHQVSPRKSGPFIALNCAAIPETMLEAMLFGHTKGAFTGASGESMGKFEAANGGTLLLDEIAELPLELQAKLLRVLQEREVERLGSHKKIKLDIRIIAATNKDLKELVDKGLFREDLYYRLDIMPLHITPLKDRPADILAMANHFIKSACPDSNVCLSDEAKQALMSHDWPGNIRELNNIIQRSLVMRRSLTIMASDLMLPQPKMQNLNTHSNACHGLKMSKQLAEFEYIIDTLKQFNGHRTKTANALGMTTRALRYKVTQMRENGIDIDEILEQLTAA